MINLPTISALSATEQRNAEAIAHTKANPKHIGPKASELTQHQLDGFFEYLDYNPETGVFLWQNHSGFKGLDGTEAGCKTKSGYVLLGVRGTRQYAHRIAWLLTHKEFPPAGSIIDHINRDGLDNRLCNLRVITQGENVRNTTTARSHGRFNALGVSKANGTPRYYSRITAAGKVTHLGSFNTIKEASAAYQAAKLIHHPGAVIVQ